MIARLTGVIQAYAWGSATMIPQLLGIEPSGEPQAELWLGAHPLAPSRVDDQPLDELLATDPRGLMGDATVQAFGPRLPFLLKVIAADQPLSLQAHPSREQAEVGFAREQAAGVPRDAAHRIYRDGWPKPEVLCALQETEALCGFREPEVSYALFERLGVDSALRLVADLASADQPPEARLAAVFERLLRLTGDPDGVVAEVVRGADAVTADGEFGLFARTARELGRFYPGDPGVLAALLMNRIVLHPNDAIYPAGRQSARVSARRRGRGDGQLRQRDARRADAQAHRCRRIAVGARFHPRFRRADPADRGRAGTVALFRAGAGVRALADRFGRHRRPLPATAGGRILLVTEGSLSLASGNEVLALVRGESAWISASETGTVHGTGTAFVGGPGIF